jgi:hypothetical protein
MELPSGNLGGKNFVLQASGRFFLHKSFAYFTERPAQSPLALATLFLSCCHIISAIDLISFVFASADAREYFIWKAIK